MVLNAQVLKKGPEDERGATQVVARDPGVGNSGTHTSVSLAVRPTTH
jgi:hypothetical protein